MLKKPLPRKELTYESREEVLMMNVESDPLAAWIGIAHRSSRLRRMDLIFIASSRLLGVHRMDDPLRGRSRRLGAIALVHHEKRQPSPEVRRRLALVIVPFTRLLGA